LRTSIEAVNDFLAQRRIAVVGASRDPKELSHVLWQELLQRRYDAVPVNPATAELDGQPCYPSVDAIQPPVDAVLVMTPAAVAAEIVDASARTGVRHVWLWGGFGGSSSSDDAVARAEAHGMQVVAGHCPYMFLPGSGGPHALHGFIKRLTGGYPKAATTGRTTA
jgi:predicted CoA-binding protein